MARLARREVAAATPGVRHVGMRARLLARVPPRRAGRRPLRGAVATRRSGRCSTRCRRYFQYRAEWWDAYRRGQPAVRRRRSCATAKDGDLVWVHDYQLMLLPQTAQAGDAVAAGRVLPAHAVPVVRHVPLPPEPRGAARRACSGRTWSGSTRSATSATSARPCLRLLGVESEMTTIRHDGHTSALGVYPIGINARQFERELDTPAFQARVRGVGGRVRGQAGRAVGRAAGLHEGDRPPARRDRAVPVAADRRPSGTACGSCSSSVPTRGGVERVPRAPREVEHRVGRINGQYATLHDSPIHFLHQSVGVHRAVRAVRAGRRRDRHAADRTG